jgi:hypothetical protein
MFKSEKNIYFHFAALTSRRKNMGGNLGWRFGKTGGEARLLDQPHKSINVGGRSTTESIYWYIVY